jgi:peptidoglycan/LPS O-acetylase OafA/YrhL
VFQVLRRLGAPDSSWFVGPFGTARPFWTISIEWWIYMLFGGVVLVWLRQGKPLGWAGALVLGVVAIEPVYHFVGGYDHCLTMLWVLGMGASLLLIRLRAMAAARPDVASPRLLRIALAVAGAASLAIVGRLFANKFAVAEFQFGLFLALLVFALFFALGFARLQVAPGLERVIAFVAGYSYSLYLVHHTLVEFLAIHYPDRQDSPAMFWIAIAAANLLAVVFWYLFERHHRQLARWAKQRFASSRPNLGTVPIPEGMRR